MMRNNESNSQRKALTMSKSVEVLYFPNNMKTSGKTATLQISNTISITTESETVFNEPVENVQRIGVAGSGKASPNWFIQINGKRYTFSIGSRYNLQDPGNQELQDYIQSDGVLKTKWSTGIPMSTRSAAITLVILAIIILGILFAVHII